MNTRTYTPIRYVSDPVAGRLCLQIRCTWGKLTELGHHNFWEYRESMPRLMMMSTAQPVVRPVLEEV